MESEDAQSGAALRAPQNNGEGDPDPDPDNGPQIEPPPPKRPRLTSASFTRRKRAVAACQFCRLRKTKCDTVKPVCGFCRYHNAKCVYVDPDEDNNSNVDDSKSADRHEEILKRFDELKTLLQLQATTATRQQTASTTQVQGQSPWTQATPAAASDSGTVTSQFTNPASVPPDTLCYTATKCESLLRWPIFEGIIPQTDAEILSFTFDSPKSDSHISPIPPAPSNFGLHSIPIGGGVYLQPAVQEEALVPLCQKFLTQVHPRNPILEPEELLSYAKATAENGLGWDGPTCLVVRTHNPLLRVTNPQPNFSMTFSYLLVH